MSGILEEIDNRYLGLSLLLVLFFLISILVLSEIFWTFFLAVTFAYVLYPLKKKLRGKLSDKLSAAVVTSSAFVLLILLLYPIFIVLFRRRQILIDFISALPDVITINLFDFTFTYPTAQLEAFAKDWIAGTAVRLAESLPSISLKAFLFAFMLYAILEHHEYIEQTLLDILPDSAETVLLGYHTRIKKTLEGIFVVQVLTAIMTFLVALPVFYFLGYNAFVSLALISAILQFVPVVGPTLIVFVLFVLEILAGASAKAFLVLLLGIGVIGFLPDAAIRMIFADRTVGMPTILYFIGFIGGLLTLGAIGVLVGPLVIAVLLETVELLAVEKKEK